MKALDTVCQHIGTDLEQLAKDIAALAADLASFEAYTALYPATWIGLRLQAVHLQIGIEVLEKYLEHGNLGSVCIMTAHDGKIAAVWFKEEPELTDAKKSWTAPVTTLPPAQFFTFIEQLQQRLHDGDWEPAVNWLKANAIWVATGDIL